MEPEKGMGREEGDMGAQGKGERMAGKENEDWNRYLLRKIWF